jgi:hypothetical protein
MCVFFLTSHLTNGRYSAHGNFQQKEKRREEKRREEKRREEKRREEKRRIV